MLAYAKTYLWLMYHPVLHSALDIMKILTYLVEADMICKQEGLGHSQHHNVIRENKAQNKTTSYLSCIKKELSPKMYH